MAYNYDHRRRVAMSALDGPWLDLTEFGLTCWLTRDFQGMVHEIRGALDESESLLLKVRKHHIEALDAADLHYDAKPIRVDDLANVRGYMVAYYTCHALGPTWTKSQQDAFMTHAGMRYLKGLKVTPL